MTPASPQADTRTALLDVAQELVQARGYNGMSFRDLAGRIGVRTASVHYHFPTKGDLGAALVARYREAFTTLRATLDAAHPDPADAPTKLLRYADALHASFRKTGGMCLCAVLAAESSTLPGEVTAQVRAFFLDNETWLTAALGRGREAGTLRFDGPPDAAARSLFAALEGALMSAWTFSDATRLSAATQWLIRPLIVRP